MLNHAVFMGRIGHDLDLRQASNGKAVLSFKIGVDRNKRRDQEKETDWFRCVAFEGTAEMIARNFSKGDLICVEGQMRVNPWTDKEGRAQTSTELIVRSVYYTESRNAREARRQREQPPQGGPYYAPAGALPEGYF